MSQDLLAEAAAAITILIDLRASLESNTVSIPYYVQRVKSELSPQINALLVSAQNSQEILTTYLPLFQLVLDPNMILFYQQPVVLEWLDLILDSLKK